MSNIYNKMEPCGTLNPIFLKQEEKGGEKIIWVLSKRQGQAFNSQFSEPVMQDVMVNVNECRWDVQQY